MLYHLAKLVPHRLKINAFKKIKKNKKITSKLISLFSRKFILGVLVIIENDKGQVLLLEHTYRDKSWGLLAGLVESSNIEAEAKREALEEIGYELENLKLLNNTNANTSKFVTFIYKANLGKKVKDVSNNLEISNYKFFSKDALPKDLSKSDKKVIEKYL